ncbi:MAG: hypothetical protein ACREBG_21625 [Pyrinomonadaceae bacterium]
MVSGYLEESLRNDIESHIQERLRGVRQEISELQSQLNESLSRLLDSQGEGQLDASVAASILEHLRAAHDEGVDLAASESTRAKASSDMAIVKAGVSEIGEQNAQADVLKILVNRSASFAPRVAFFAIKGDRAIGWRARGFEGTVGDNAIQHISLSVSADSIIGDVTRSRTTWSGGPHSHSEDHLILNKLGEEPPQRIVAVPLIVRNRTVAVLYADSAGLDSEAINLEALETLARVSGMAVELLAGHAAAKRAETAPAAVEAAPTPQQQSEPAYVPQREYQETLPPVAVEEAFPQAEVQPVESQHVEAPSVFEAPPEVDQSVLEPPPAQVAEPAAPAAPRRRYGMDVELPVQVDSDEERRLHVDARRFARLLVSEIKLYNEQKVADGREQNDLYERLREYIDRSREMYDKRVKPEVAQKFDYFHHEIVGTLAEGDAAKLGNAYPGATVSA